MPHRTLSRLTLSGLLLGPLSAAPVITEFLADNSSNRTDEDNDYPDWIEIHNPDSTPVDLAGWHLTDDPTSPNKWTFPSHTLAPGDYLIVFASGKNRTTSGSELHTNFALASSGGSLALLSPASTIESSYDYPRQAADISFGQTKAGNELVLINQSSSAKAIVPSLAYHNSVGVTWRDNDPAFDDSTWLGGPLGVGFERSSGFENEFSINVESAWLNTSSVYIRIPIPGTLDPTTIQSLTLRMKYDDGFAAFINGIYAAGANDPATLTWNSDAEGDVTDAEALQFQDFDLTASIPDLVATGNILAIHGLNRFSNSSDFLIRPELIAAVSSSVPPSLGYFETPTPGGENPSANLDALLEDTRFQIGRGYFTTPFTETITTTDPGATIIYTTDGSIPSRSNGVQVPAPDAHSIAQAFVPISTTTILRAIAVRDNALPTNVDTQTYLFHRDVLTQDGAGLPSPSNSTSIWDYDMDSNVVNDPRYPAIDDDLRSLPALSISLPAEDMWGSDGIYANPTQFGPAWERSCSVEYFLTDGTPAFQTDAGIRIQGAGSRYRDLGKKSLRVIFRKEYGEAKLNFPLFDGKGARELDNIVLRGAYFDSWTVHTSGSGTEGIGRRNSMLLRDEFGRQTHHAMGASPTVQGNWAHVYLNGLYWGVYNLHERIDEHFAEDRFGYDDSEYDVLKQRPRGQSNGSPPEIVSGDLTAWNTLLATLNDDIASQPVYDSVRGQLDVDSFADYLILNFWGANVDWPHNNWYAVRHRPTNARFTFISWDVENFIFATNAVGQLNTTVNNSPGIIWSRLRLNDEFMMDFADRVQQHCFNNGALAPAENIARFETIASEIRPAMNAESARWGDTREEPPLNTIDHFDPLVNQKITSYFPARTNIFIDQLRNEDLFPDTVAPAFSQYGGQIPVDTEVTINNPNDNGSIFFTTDGSDPRLQGGDINPAASSGNLTTISSPLSLKARVRANSGEWSALASADFVTGSDPGPRDLVISEIHYHPADARPDELLAGFADQDDFEFIELTNSGSSPLDLTNMAFTNGITFAFSALPPEDRLLPANGRVILVRNAAAFNHRYPGIKVLGEYSGSLSNSGETITLSLSNSPYLSVTYNDRVPWPESSDGSGFSLVLTNLSFDLQSPLSWQASPTSNGSPTKNDLVDFTGNASGDDNHDGLNNLLHFAFTNASQPFLVPSVPTTSPAGTFTFQRNLFANLAYHAEYSLDLVNWIPLAQDDLLDIIRVGDGNALYRFQSPVPTTENPRQLFRLRVVAP